MDGKRIRGKGEQPLVRRHARDNQECVVQEGGVLRCLSNEFFKT